MRDQDEHFTGTFAGEVKPTQAKPANASSILNSRQAAALSKYAIDPNKPVRVRKPARPAPSFGAIALTLGIVVVSCVVAGGLLFKLTPQGSLAWSIGEVLLVGAAVFVFALMYVAGRRRR
jgi:hypothetical protein